MNEIYLPTATEVELPTLTPSGTSSIKWYHGTTIPNITRFHVAEESTIWDWWIYFTLDKDLALWYWLLRKKEREKYEKTQQTWYLYEVELSDARILNLSENSNITPIMEVFKFYLEWYLSEISTLSERFELNKVRTELWEKAINRAIASIDNGEINGWNIKLIWFWILWKIFTEIVTKKLGFDGVACWEWWDDKEFTSTPWISVVIYNPDRIKNITSSDIKNP